MRVVRLIFSISWAASLLLLVGCNAKQRADEAWVDSVLSVLDSIPDDTLAYAITEEPLSQAVDENFMDFIYTFAHNNKFQMERANLPLTLECSAHGSGRVIKSSRDFRTVFNPTSTDYYVMLLNGADELEQDYASVVQKASVNLVDLQESHVRQFNYARNDGQWRITNVSEEHFDDHPLGAFFDFYGQFVSDSTYRYSHIAQPLNISIPDEDDPTEMIEVTIDSDQFGVFAPQLPDGVMMVMDYGNMPQLPKRVVMVKCGMASSMMDILTFEHENGEWRLTKIEE